MTSVLRLRDVSVKRGEKLILDSLSFDVKPGEQWVVLGPNGAGKTTLVSLLGTLLFPTTGALEILGEEIGLVDVFELRPRIGISSAALTPNFADSAKVLDVVRTAVYGMTSTWQEAYEASDNDRAIEILKRWGVHELADRTLGTLSEGERKRVQIARALMPNPELLILDEPAAGLDIAAREQLTKSLTDYIATATAPNTILITHHVEEIPPTATHALLLREGKVVAQGNINQVLTSGNLSATFEIALTVGIIDTTVGRRWSSRLA
jgi:iron complex transport system ATP-binding protein